VRINTYVVEHDLGFAPNPFFGVCTLACCKPRVRKYAKEGDIIVGTGAKRPNRQGYLIYWMKVDKIITFDQFWQRSKYALKKPDMSGSAMQRYGDNIYHRDPEKREWVQADSFHSEPNGKPSPGNLKRDTGTTEKVMVGYEFAYWGRSGPKIPEHLRDFVVAGQGHKCRFKQDRVDAFLAWLAGFPERGYRDEPADWQFIEI
jgi:hypothetical protein